MEIKVYAEQLRPSVVRCDAVERWRWGDGREWENMPYEEDEVLSLTLYRQIGKFNAVE